MIVPIPANRSVPVYPGTQHPAVTVVNSGTVTVFLSERYASSADLPLNPGASLVWPAHRPLYVFALAVTAVVVAEGVDQLTDPTAIADALIAAGLAADIAAAILGNESNPAGAPTTAPRAGTRNVSAESSTTLTFSSPANGAAPVNAAGTIVAAPGAGKSLELHGALLTTRLLATGATNTLVITITLERLDTGGTILSWSLAVPAGSTVAGAQPFDFQGATLPPNVGVRLRMVSGAIGPVGSGTETVESTLTYATVQ